MTRRLVINEGLPHTLNDDERRLKTHRKARLLEENRTFGELGIEFLT